MGGELFSVEKENMPHGSKSEINVEKWKIPNNIPISDIELAKLGIFKYHRSWDWIMPVVEHIEKKLNYPIIRECDFPIEISLIYDKVINFIDNQKI